MKRPSFSPERANLRPVLPFALFLPILFFQASCSVSSQDGIENDLETAKVTETLQDFHAALATGNREGVRRLLAPDAVILEGGGLESRSEYQNHHLSADITFARTTKREIISTEVHREGAMAWAATVSRIHGLYMGKRIDLEGAELSILKKKGGDWKITAIHWSSLSRSE